MTRRISPPATYFLHTGLYYVTVVLGFFKLNGQTRHTRILERNPLIDTSYRIGHRFELKYFHIAQFLLNAHRAEHRL